MEINENENHHQDVAFIYSPRLINELNKITQIRGRVSFTTHLILHDRI